MKRYARPVWLRGAFILSVILIGTSMGGSLQTVLAEGNPLRELEQKVRNLQAQVDALTISGGAVQSLVVPYSLGPGAFSAPITPVRGKAVLVIGVLDTPGLPFHSGVGQATILSTGSDPQLLQWVGVGALGGPIISGTSAVFGTRIAPLSSVAPVAIEVYNGESFIVHNNGPDQQIGYVKLIW